MIKEQTLDFWMGELDDPMRGSEVVKKEQIRRLIREIRHLKAVLRTTKSPLAGFTVVLADPFKETIRSIRKQISECLGETYCE